MKKSLTLAIILIFVMTPLASFARTAISDSELDSVIAQQGVTIEFVSVTLNNVSMNTFAWGDAGGFIGYTGDGLGWAGKYHHRRRCSGDERSHEHRYRYQRYYQS